MAQKLYNSKLAKHPSKKKKLAKHDIASDISNEKSADVLHENSPIPKKV
jgi:hypothetical protein